MFLSSFFTRIGSDVHKLLDKADDELKTLILPAAHAVCSVAKAIVVFDSDDIIGGLAGAAGAAIEDKLRQALPVVVLDLQMAQTLLNAGTPEQILKIVLQNVSSFSPSAKQSFFDELQHKVVAQLSKENGELSVADASMLSNLYNNSVTLKAA